jgi:hypothetical protein
LNYPENVIWYIEAGTPYKPAQNCGSAVAIRLQRRGTPATGKTYLLTCAHVVRGSDSNSAPGVGPLLSNINAWPPGGADGKTQARKATIAATIKDLLPGEVPPDQRKNAADDWVILEIEDAQTASAADPVEQWSTAANSSACRIYSYPGGRLAFQEGMVEPTPSHDDFPYRKESMGVLYLHGDASRAGSSGGGVFLEPGNGFVGIHRARDHDTLQVHAVSARKIRDYLQAMDYEPVEQGQRSTPLQRQISELRHKLWTAKDDELKRIRFEVKALRAKEQNKWDPELHQLELDVQRAMKSLQRPAFSDRYGRRQWVKVFVVAASLLITATAAIWIVGPWFVGPGDPTVPLSTQVICRIFDAQTHDPIERVFTITNQRGEAQECGLGRDCRVLASFLEPLDGVRIECEGYEPTPNLDCPIETGNDPSVEEDLRTFCLQRDASYIDTITPEDPPEWLSDMELSQIEELHPLVSGPVTVLVRNDTQYRPDLLLYPFRETDEMPTPGGREPKIIEGSKLEGRGEYSDQSHLALDKQKLGFTVYISFFGRRAQKIDPPLYFDGQFAVIRIVNNRPPYAEIVSPDTDPRDNQ